ncbi:NAD(P)/FAD-dependent oxidoreductase [Streptomyces sp. NPDC060065]|uniref:NAD(P)/FAD-dependent oxidoreductase n=1 Tax=Streptomyces sp. NPDC060065 TaxID=3347050 RepID=UPI00368615B9
MTRNATGAHARRVEVPNGHVSFWHTQLPPAVPRPALDGDVSCDVAIIGGGFTGLWTAYYLMQAQPSLDIAVIEAATAGYGASGRNGGWLSAELVGSRERYAATAGRESVLNLTKSMQASIDEVIRVAHAEKIHADIEKSGSIKIARNPAQRARLKAHTAYLNDWGAEHERIEPRELNGRINVDGVVAAAYTPHCARLHPAKLVRGLADAVERLGVRIYENTRCVAIEPHTARTDRGTVSARSVLRCLEGFTATVSGLRREWLPMNSSMIVTDPLPADVARQIRWDGNETLSDSAHAYMYAQHTADGRIALGGRGVPYRFGSRTDADGRTQARTVEALTTLLHRLFPAASKVPIAHAWCGVLGVPRDWCATVNFDPGTGLGAAGGYVGSGVTTAHLAGRTLADLALGKKTERAALPWVGRAVRRWEPEPLRWAGVQAIYALYREADRSEYRSQSDRTSVFAKAAALVSGR